jgi:hypothetical protein
LANGVVLTSGVGTTHGQGKPWADMNNGGGKLDSKGNKSVGGLRFNYFRLDNKTIIDKIMAADTTKKGYIRLTSKCVPNTINNSKNGGCHSDVPHITVTNTDGKLVLDTYPKSDDAYLVTIDKCGNWIHGGGGKLKQSADVAANNKPTETNKTPGRRLSFAAAKTGTLTSDQYITNLVNNGSIQKNPKDGTYTVLKTFTVGTNTYKPNDIIAKILPKGSEIIFPS